MAAAENRALVEHDRIALAVRFEIAHQFRNSAN
jgi:hypothetical protein